MASEKLYQNIAIGCLVFFVVGITVGVGFPRLMEKMIKSSVNLKPGSETRKMWEKFPISIDFSIYVFNVTNPEDCENGGKPRLQEVGPFVFEEWKDKYDLEDDEAEDAVSFNMRNTFIFRPDLGLSGEEIIIFPHPLIQIMSIAVKRDKAPLLGMIADGIEALFKPKSAFITAPAIDIFFRGFDVDCTAEGFAAEAICLNFHTGVIKGAVKIDENHFKFSLMGGSNHSDAGRFKVSRGIRDYRTIGQVLLYDDEEQLNVWPGDECNKFHGTDSTIFAPLMKPSEGMWTFSGELCRSMSPQFEKKTKYNGLPVYRYGMDLGDVKNEPENHCFCKDYPHNCPPKGTMDLSLCNEAPMIISLPHFYKADPALLDDIDGLQPDEKKHSIFIDFERITGSPVNVAKRLQFNLDVEPVEQIPTMSKLRPLLMPLFWVEEAASLSTDFTDIIKGKVFTTKTIVKVFMWNAIVIGLCGAGFSGLMIYLRRRDELKVIDIKS